TRMCTDTLHFGGDMLGITGTPAIPTQHHLPLTSEGGDQLAGDLHDETRCSRQLPDDGEMLFERFVHPPVQIHTSAPSHHIACIASASYHTVYLPVAPLQRLAS